MPSRCVATHLTKARKRWLKAWTSEFAVCGLKIEASPPKTEVRAFNVGFRMGWRYRGKYEQKKGGLDG